MSFYKLAVLLVAVICFYFGSSTYAVAKKTARLDACTTGTPLSYKTAKKACKSGNYPGETVVTCKKKRKGEKQKDRRVCNSDNKKKGVYVDHCGGVSTGFKNLKKACQAGNHFGSLLVKCKRGKEKKRQFCAEANEEQNKITVFGDQCGGDIIFNGQNLRRICKNNPGAVVVKCKRKRNIWKEKKAMQCSGEFRDRFKLSNCTPNERQIIISDYQRAEERIDAVVSSYNAVLAANSPLSSALQKKMDIVEKKLGKIQKAMDRPRKYCCKRNKSKGLCATSTAHTLPTGRRVTVCQNYFKIDDHPGNGFDGQLERASIIVHEISHHKVQTNDKGRDYGGCNVPRLPNATDDFHKHADYYEHVAECGLVVPN